MITAPAPVGPLAHVREGGRLWKLVNFAVLQAAWFGCVLAAAAARPDLACVAAFAALAVHFALVRSRFDDLRMIAVAVPLGFATDTAVGALGVVAPVHDPVPAPFPPSWFPLLWAVFATAVRHSMGWLSGSYALAALVGALGGPLSLRSGGALGGVAVTDDARVLWSVVGLQWAIVLPLLVRCAARGPAAPPRTT